MPATLALRVMLGLIHLLKLYASLIDKSILARGIVTRDTLRGHTVSKNGSISFYAGCPEGAYRV